MSTYGFTSAFAAQLEEYLAFKQSMGCYGTSRYWYLRRFDAYCAQDYSLSRLEAQKLAYFLQAAGEPLKLNYEKQQYGPYAHNLNHVLQVMEGSFIRGYGDGTQKSEIRTLPGAVQAAQAFLADDPDAQRLSARSGLSLIHI